MLNTLITVIPYELQLEFGTNVKHKGIVTLCSRDPLGSVFQYKQASTFPKVTNFGESNTIEGHILFKADLGHLLYSNHLLSEISTLDDVTQVL